MIDKNYVLELINSRLQEIDAYLVDLKISASNVISVEIDKMGGVAINDCVAVSRNVEHNLDREEQDFELRVSSPGITEPFKVFQQYEKNMGRDIHVVAENGEEAKGELINANDKSFTILTKPVKGAKSKKIEAVPAKELTFNIDEVKSTKLILKF